MPACPGLMCFFFLTGVILRGRGDTEGACLMFVYVLFCADFCRG